MFSNQATKIHKLLKMCNPTSIFFKIAIIRIKVAVEI